MKIARKEQTHTRTLIALVAVMVVVVLAVWAVQMYGMFTDVTQTVVATSENGLGPENEAFLENVKASISTSDVDIGSSFATLKSEVESAVVQVRLQTELAQKMQDQLAEPEQAPSVITDIIEESATQTE